MALAFFKKIILNWYWFIGVYILNVVLRPYLYDDSEIYLFFLRASAVQVGLGAILIYRVSGLKFLSAAIFIPISFGFEYFNIESASRMLVAFLLIDHAVSYTGNDKLGNAQSTKPKK